jgi:membrane protease YdiL (CAAX protease family)
MDIQEYISELNETENPATEFEGKWERKNRNLNVAAIVGLLGIGALYFNLQSILATITTLITMSLGPELQTEGNYFERLAANMEVFNDPLKVVVLITQFLFMLLPTILLVKWWHTKNVKKYIRLNKTSFGEVILAVLATLAIIPAGNYVSNELVRWINIPDFYLEISVMFFKANSPLEFVWLIFVVAITPAICEEVFFRGYVQRTFERTMKFKSVLLVGFIFGLFHMQPLGLFTLSILGMLFGYFYYKSESLLPAMAAHFTNNFLAVLILYNPEPIQQFNLAAIEQIPLEWILITLPIGIGLVYLYKIVAERKIESLLF